MSMFARLPIILAALTAAATSAGAEPRPVTPANFSQAETEKYMAAVVKRGGMGQFAPVRELATPEMNLVVRPNRDTLYSTALFDLDAGPVTIRLPDAGQRYLSMMVINGDHHVQQIEHGEGAYRIDRASVGTRYALVGIRIFVDPTRPGDLDAVHRLQDAVTVEQPGGPGSFVRTDWDAASYGKVRGALFALGETLPDMNRAFGKAGEVDPVEHLIGTAMAWGGLPRTEATYLNITPARNDGAAVYRLNVGAVPVDAFWSITVYDRDGKLIPNPQQLYSLNSVTVRHARDHSAAIQFGGCAAGQQNCLPVLPGWNYMVRLYRPRAAILDGSWTFPAAVVVEK